MGKSRQPDPDPDFLPGTLEMLILKTVSRGQNHGYGIAQHIRLISGDALKIGEGSLYPALQRLLIDDYLEAEWGVSENNRRARFYRITAAGRRKLAEEKKSFDFLLEAITRVMEAPMKIRHRLRYFISRRRLDRELAEELRIHEDNRNVTFSKTIPPLATVKFGPFGRSSTPRCSAFRRTISSISLALR